MLPEVAEQQLVLVHQRYTTRTLSVLSEAKAASVYAFAAEIEVAVAVEVVVEVAVEVGIEKVVAQVSQAAAVNVDVTEGHGVRIQVAVEAEVSALHDLAWTWHLAAANHQEEGEMEVVVEFVLHAQVRVPEAGSVGFQMPTERRCGKRGRSTLAVVFVVLARRRFG